MPVGLQNLYAFYQGRTAVPCRIIRNPAVRRVTKIIPAVAVIKIALAIPVFAIDYNRHGRKDGILLLGFCRICPRCPAGYSRTAFDINDVSFFAGQNSNIVWIPYPFWEREQRQLKRVLQQVLDKSGCNIFAGGALCSLMDLLNSLYRTWVSSKNFDLVLTYQEIL